jgi:hypothetical protein
MTSEERANIGIDKMTTAEQEAFARWSWKIFQRGQHVVEDIDEIKYGGRLIILNDGTRWEVDDYDAATVELWSTLDKVLIVDDEMYNIEDCEKVSVTEES